MFPYTAAEDAAIIFWMLFLTHALKMLIVPSTLILFVISGLSIDSKISIFAAKCITKSKSLRLFSNNE